MRQLSVLVYKEDNSWLAQCLEYDIAAQEKSPEQVIEAFKWVFWSHISYDIEKQRDLLSTLPRAPERFWSRWNASEALLTTQIPLSPEEADAQSIEEHVRLDLDAAA